MNLASHFVLKAFFCFNGQNYLFNLSRCIELLKKNSELSIVNEFLKLYASFNTRSSPNVIRVNGTMEVLRPDIDMDESVKTWILKGAAEKRNRSQIANLLVWTFRLEFCRQYYKQKKS